MRNLLANLLLASTMPTAAMAEDRYSGVYAAECGALVCELRITPAGRDRWKVAWSATDPRDHSLKPQCRFNTTAEIGSASMGQVGVVEGIAVGRVRGRPFGIFDLEPGRVSWSSGWEACPGIAPKGHYSSYGDE